MVPAKNFSIIPLLFCGLLFSSCACSSTSTPEEEAPAQETTEQPEVITESDSALPETGESDTPKVPSTGSNSVTTNSAVTPSTPNTPKQEQPQKQPSTEPASPSHTHLWTPKTVHHDAVYEQQYIDDWVWFERYKCKTCGAFTYSISEANGHQEASGRGGCGAYVSAEYQENRGYYEQVCVQSAYDEVVGYVCSCGATK